MTRLAEMPVFAGLPELADVVADRLGDVTDDVIVLRCPGVLVGSKRFGDRLLTRLLVEGGARRVEVAGSTREFWECMLAAAQELGVADRLEYRMAGRIYAVAFGAS